VSTWYGGILGVGEYSYRFGLSNWLVFGLPYYLAAALFAVFLAKKARAAQVLTIPERLAQVYDNKTALAGAVIIYLLTVPGAMYFRSRPVRTDSRHSFLGGSDRWFPFLYSLCLSGWIFVGRAH